MSQLSMNTHGVEAPPLAPYHLFFNFRTNGGADPVAFRGTIESVTRLTSTGGVPFYRVATGLDGRVLADKSTIYYAQASAQGDIDGGEVLDVRIPDGLTMPSTPAGKANEIDLVVYDGGVATNSVAAGRLVGVRLLFDRDIAHT